MSSWGAPERHEGERSSGLGLRATRRGEVLAGTYRLLELVGAGGMAEVYSAEHLRLGRKFAVKVLRAGISPQSGQRFRREARAIARIENEFVVGVVDCGEADDGTPYLVMDLLHGEDLRSLLEREGALPIPRAVHLVWEACQGISAVHALSLIHRDLKPENLFVSKRATGEDWCKVLDFGIAKSDVSSSTVEGALIGTVRYMAPEQLQDAASVCPTVDVYTLGAVLYECVSGASPHHGSTVQELMFKILNERAARLELRRQGVPKGLADVVERALAKSPGERFANVKEFAAAIGPYAFSGVDQLHERRDLDGRAATVELESAGIDMRSGRRPSSKSYFAIAISGFSGLIIGAALRAPETFSPTSARVAPASAARPSANVPSAIASPSATSTGSALPLLSPALSANAPAGNAVVFKARVNSPSRRPPALPHARFDSENPYDR